MNQSYSGPLQMDVHKIAIKFGFTFEFFQVGNGNEKQKQRWKVHFTCLRKIGNIFEFVFLNISTFKWNLQKKLIEEMLNKFPLTLECKINQNCLLA